MMESESGIKKSTERQFERFVKEMIDDIGTDNYQDELMSHFDFLVGDIGGTDLIYYSKPAADDSA